MRIECLTCAKYIKPVTRTDRKKTLSLIYTPNFTLHELSYTYIAINTHLIIIHSYHIFFMKTSMWCFILIKHLTGAIGLCLCD